MENVTVKFNRSKELYSLLNQWFPNVLDCDPLKKIDIYHLIVIISLKEFKGMKRQKYQVFHKKRTKCR